jgi:hypothetical protein
MAHGTLLFIVFRVTARNSHRMTILDIWLESHGGASIHLLLHFIGPALVAGVFFRRDWKISYLIMIATMLVDLDHLLANPIYDPQRCSIGFHPLHTFWAIAIYLVLCYPKKTRYIGIGLMIHMVLDSIDCQYTNGIWFT